jgi:hypothetical protein
MKQLPYRAKVLESSKRSASADIGHYVQLPDLPNDRAVSARHCDSLIGKNISFLTPVWYLVDSMS